jgi:magnesium transporter
LDLYDHMSRIVEVVDTRREQLTDVAELLMAVTAQRTNDIMKVLTIVSTIFMPLTLVVGIYGMNFVNMPELHWPWGYPLVLLAMAGMAVGMLAYFRKRGWI